MDTKKVENDRAQTTMPFFIPQAEDTNFIVSKVFDCKIDLKFIFRKLDANERTNGRVTV